MSAPISHSKAKLRKALRGGFGYAAQQEAWDAVLPAWREAIEIMVGSRDGFLSQMRDRRRRPEWWDQFTAALRADGGFLARAWYQLLMQSMYRSCPALGGWFPE